MSWYWSCSDAFIFLSQCPLSGVHTGVWPPYSFTRHSERRPFVDSETVHRPVLMCRCHCNYRCILQHSVFIVWQKVYKKIKNYFWKKPVLSCLYLVVATRRGSTLETCCLICSNDGKNMWLLVDFVVITGLDRLESLDLFSLNLNLNSDIELLFYWVV